MRVVVVSRRWLLNIDHGYHLAKRNQNKYIPRLYNHILLLLLFVIIYRVHVIFQKKKKNSETFL